MKRHTLEVIFRRFGHEPSCAGYFPRGGQIVDATRVLALRQRLGAGEKQAVQGSSEAQDIWPDACGSSNLIAQCHD